MLPRAPALGVVGLEDHLERVRHDAVPVAQAHEAGVHELRELRRIVRVAQRALHDRRIPPEVGVIDVDVQLLAPGLERLPQRGEHVLHAEVEVVEGEAGRIDRVRITVVVDLLESRLLPGAIRHPTFAELLPAVGRVLHPARDLEPDGVDADRVDEEPVHLGGVRLDRGVVAVARLVLFPHAQVRGPAIDRLMAHRAVDLDLLRRRRSLRTRRRARRIGAATGSQQRDDGHPKDRNRSHRINPPVGSHGRSATGIARIDRS